jgi:hypothetical protein
MSERRTRTFVYASTTQDITACNADIQTFLSDYAVASFVIIPRVYRPCKFCQLYEQATIKRQNEEVRSQVAQVLIQLEQMSLNTVSLNTVSIRGCATLIDAVGHEYKVPLTFCASFEVSFVLSNPYIESNRHRLLTGLSSNLSIWPSCCYSLTGAEHPFKSAILSQEKLTFV